MANQLWAVSHARARAQSCQGLRLVSDRASGKPSYSPNEDVKQRMVEILPQLRRFASSLTRDVVQSEDLVQETFVRALTHLGQWQPGSRLDSWMYRIAQNLWVDHLRAERTRGERVDILALEHFSDCDGRLVVENRLTLVELRERIGELSPSQRQLLLLVCVEGLSYREAAEALHSPAGTIMSRLARARMALCEAISRSAPFSCLDSRSGPSAAGAESGGSPPEEARKPKGGRARRNDHIPPPKGAGTSWSVVR